MPTAMGDIRRTRDDSLLPPQAPLAGLPCWFLNSFIFLAPTAVIVSILVPGIKLVNAVKSSEESACEQATNAHDLVFVFLNSHRCLFSSSCSEHDNICRPLGAAVGS